MRGNGLALASVALLVAATAFWLLTTSASFRKSDPLDRRGGGVSTESPPAVRRSVNESGGGAISPPVAATDDALSQNVAVDPLVIGRVVLRETGEPVHGGTVRAWFVDAEDPEFARGGAPESAIDADGWFRVERPKDSFLLKFLSVVARDANGRWFEFLGTEHVLSPMLKTTEATADITVEVTRGESVSGVVVDDATDRPIEDVLVTSDLDRPPSARSDAAGRFTVMGLAPRPVDGSDAPAPEPWQARHPDYLTRSFWQSAPYAGERSPPVTLRLARAVRIAGRVIDAANAPVRGARVRLSNGDAERISGARVCATLADATTDSEGRFVFSPIRGTKHGEIEVALPDRAPTRMHDLDLSRDRDDVLISLGSERAVTIVAVTPEGLTLAPALWHAMIDDGDGLRVLDTGYGLRAFAGEKSANGWKVRLPAEGAFDLVVMTRGDVRKDPPPALRGSVHLADVSDGATITVPLTAATAPKAFDWVWSIGPDDHSLLGAYAVKFVDRKTGEAIERGAFHVSFEEGGGCSNRFDPEHPLTIGLGPMRGIVTISITGYEPIPLLVNGRPGESAVMTLSLTR